MTRIIQILNLKKIKEIKKYILNLYNDMDFEKNKSLKLDDVMKIHDFADDVANDSYSTKKINIKKK